MCCLILCQLHNLLFVHTDYCTVMSFYVAWWCEAIQPSWLQSLSPINTYLLTISALFADSWLHGKPMSRYSRSAVVCLSVCPSVTFVDCDQTAIDRVMISMQADRASCDELDLRTVARHRVLCLFSNVVAKVGYGLEFESSAR